MTNKTPATAPTPYEDVKSLDRLVGNWQASDPSGKGGIEGTTSFEWMQGGFFLIQHVNLGEDDSTKGIEIIGHERKFGETEPSEDIRSRFYSNTGDTFDYVYELEGDNLTIWGGEKGSPGNFKGTFSAEGTTLAGRWVWPGGGYEALLTRIPS